ncbi:ABC transporter substrate-binding protein, partial [Streptomyces sp. MCAF7]
NKLGDPSIAGSPWREDYKKVDRLGTERITREIVVDAKADWVLAGWNSGFGEDRGITPALLKKVNIASYVHTETCFGYGDKKLDVAPLEALYTDLENLGRIFGVEQRADKLVAGLKSRVSALKKTWPKKNDPAKVLVYDSGTDQPFTA